MMKAFVAAAYAFYEALPERVSLKVALQEKLESEITLIEVIRCKASMLETAASDTTGETTFAMVYEDRLKNCKDAELEAQLNRFYYRYCDNWILISCACLIFIFSLSNVINVDPKSAHFEWLNSLSPCAFIVYIFFPWILSVCFLLGCISYSDVAKQYEVELRKRLILNRIKKNIK